MTSQDPEDIAEQRCAHLSPGAQLAFLIAFSRARDDVATGADIDGIWDRMIRRDTLAASIAGYLEGLASTRVPRTSRTKRTTQ